MAGIPPALDTDAEDVAWALQTAEALWKRGERADAIVWLRRAAQSAGDAQDDDRALVLARSAAELAEWLAHNPVISISERRPSSIPPPTGEAHGVDDLLRHSSPDIPVSFSEPALPVADDADLRPRAIPPQRPMAPPMMMHPADDEPNTLEIDVAAYRKAQTSDVAPTAAEAHRGMLDPWAAPPPLPHERPRTPPPPERMDDEEVITSARDLPSGAIVEPPPNVPSGPAPTPPVEARQPPPLPPKRPPPVPKKPPKRMAARRDRVRKEMRSEPPPSDQPPAQLEEEGKVYTADPISMLSAARGGAPSRPPSIPPEGPGSMEPAPTAAILAAPVEPTLDTVTLPIAAVRPPPEPTLVSQQAAPQPRAPLGDVEDEPTMQGPAVREILARELLREDLKLGDVAGLSDLPDEEREKLQNNATIHKLDMGDEVGGFALALVVRGDVDVAAQIVDVPADRISTGTVLRGRGSIPDGVPLRLMCASQNAVVATWQSAEIDPALETCPWVVDDLRAQADRVQALVGVTLGPLADRLDAELRRQVTSRLQLRELAEGEVIVEQGKPVRQILIVGQGHVELVKDGDVNGTVGAGELLFPSEILSAGTAPATARAGKGGALVLQADRGVAQELMVTCPPLLEIFGGM
jgi:hypothetical protein